MARATGLEPATSGVTGRHSNQLSYARAGLPKRCCRRRGVDYGDGPEVSSAGARQNEDVPDAWRNGLLPNRMTQALSA
jgi:hypothetical protein